MRKKSRKRKARVALAALYALGCGGEPRPDCTPSPAPGVVGSLCGFHNPEDVEVVASADLLLVSEMRIAGWAGGGSLAGVALGAGDGAFVPRRLWPAPAGSRRAAAAGGQAGDNAPVGDPDCDEPPSAEQFSPHGLTSMATAEPGQVRVAVVSHAPREAIELFDLRGRGDAATLAWRGCVPLPPETSANDVALAPDGQIVATNYMPTPHGLRGTFYFLAGALGRETGDLLVWRRESGWRHLPGTRGASPNGVAVSPDGANVFYAETGAGRVVRVPREGSLEPRERDSVAIAGRPDNLSWSARGMLLVAAHDDGPAFLACAFGQTPCRSAWSLYAIDPVTLRASDLLTHDGSAVGAVASAADATGTTYLGAVFGDRIGVWVPAR